MSTPRPDPRVVDVLPAQVRVIRPAAGGPGVPPPGAGPRGGDHAGGPGKPRTSVFTGEVGDLRPGDAGTQGVLARYLVVRTVGDDAVRALLAVALLGAAVTLLLALVGAPTVLTVLAGIATLLCFVGWRLVRALWRRLSLGTALAPVAPELARLVAGTRPAARRELRRVGLPGHPFAAFVLAPRLVGARRPETVARMRRFEVDRVAPAGRVDELYLLLERARRGAPTAR